MVTIWLRRQRKSWKALRSGAAATNLGTNTGSFTSSSPSRHITLSQRLSTVYGHGFDWRMRHHSMEVLPEAIQKGPVLHLQGCQECLEMSH